MSLYFTCLDASVYEFGFIWDLGYSTHLEKDLNPSGEGTW